MAATVARPLPHWEGTPSHPSSREQMDAARSATQQHAADQELWLNLRRGLLFMVDAIERYQGIPSVIEQYERRQSARKS